MQCVILCGGMATRLSHKYYKTPKALIKFNNKPNLEILINNLKKNTITNFIFLTGHKSNIIREFINKRKDIKFKILDDTKYSGTGGAILNQLHYLENKFLVVMGDLYCDFNFKKFLQFSKKKKADICLASHANSHPNDSDTVECRQDFSIKKIYIKNQIGNRENNALSGIYYFKRKIFSKLLFKKRKIDLIKDIVLKKKDKIFSYKSLDYVKDFGTDVRIKQVRKDLKILKNKKKIFSVFIDRDGVINKEIGHVKNIKDFEIIKGTGKAIRKLNKNFIPCFLVSNQAGIAKGIIKIGALKSIHQKLDNYLSNYNAYIDDFLICPNSPKIKIDIKNYLFFFKHPKPDPSMLDLLAKRHSINLKSSYFIGDSDLDILCGKKRKMKTFLVDSPRKKKYLLNVKPNFRVKSLNKAVEQIFKNEKICSN